MNIGFQRGPVTVLGTVILGAALAQAQQAGTPRIIVRSGQGVGGATVRYVSPWSGSLRWLSNEAVKKELELVDEQVEQINQVRTQLQKDLQAFYKDLGGLSAQERQQRYRDRNAELAETTEKKLKDILLPEQLDRLKQIDLQMRLRGYHNMSGVLTSDELVDALDITDKQKDQLREAQRKVQREVQEKLREFYAKMREEAEERILGVLTARQRQRLEKMLGEKFEFQPYGLMRPGTPSK